ncbi:MAG: hypothetical protein ACI9G1_001029, partial [Pirellulaceae bacterium]
MRPDLSRSTKPSRRVVAKREFVRHRRNRKRQFETLERRLLLAAEISEIMADNDTTLRDVDGDYGDWIELRNTSGVPVSLGGMYLTNDTNNLTMWELPASLTLNDDEHLVIFASGKDRISGPELHTSFELNEAGGSVALVDVNGSTIVSQFASYPALGTDEAYGLLRSATTTDLIGDGSAVNVLIPVDGSLNATWTGGNEPFDDSTWLAGTSPVGYDAQAGSGFAVDEIRSTVTVNSLAVADGLIAGNNVDSIFSTTSSTINMLGSGPAGNFANDDAFPGQTIGQDLNDFIIHATTNIFVTSQQAGAWTFGINAADGSRLIVDSTTVISDNTTHGAANVFGTINLDPGPHSLDFVFFESTGDGEAELFAAPGTLNSFSNAFKLVGDSANGGLAVGGYDAIAQLNLEAALHNQSSTAYARYDFNISDVDSVLNLALTINHDDGFTAYLNGVQVAAVNSPALADFNSSALTASGYQSSTLDVTSFVGNLVTGNNVLAIHGLNSSISDGEFLLQPIMSARVATAPTAVIIDLPTPGNDNDVIEPLITEFQASNNSTTIDEDGDSSDWVEIHNPGTLDFNIGGWYLTDDPNDLVKWQLPTTILDSGEYDLVFASQKDRAQFGSELHTNFKLAASSEYLALVKPDGTTVVSEFGSNGSVYPQQFQDISYGLNGVQQASLTVAGNRPIGVSDAGYLVRQVLASATFAGQVQGQVGGGGDPLLDADALLSLPANDPGIEAESTFVYDTVNFFDAAGGDSNGTFGTDESFPLDVFDEDEDDFAVSITANLIIPPDQGGEFIFAFHGDEGGRLKIDGVDVILDNTSHTAQTVQGTVTLADGIHSLEFVQFERTGGSSLELLYASVDGPNQGSFELLAIVDPVALLPSTLLNRPSVYFETPTPGAANNAGIALVLGNTTFSVPHGFHDTPFTVAIANEHPDAEIHYTLDGREPTQGDPLYSSALNVAFTTTLRAKAFLATGESSLSNTVTYIFLDSVYQQAKGVTPLDFPSSWGNNNVEYGLDSGVLSNQQAQLDAAFTQIPSLSLSIDTASLFDAANGIYANAGQRGRAWERETSVELIYPENYVNPFGDTLDTDGFQINAGLRIRGGFSRSAGNPKHAFRAFFRSEYGESKLNYELFGDEGTNSFDTIDFRTAQNYSWSFSNSNRNTFLRDVFSRDLQGAAGDPYTRGRYYHMYINGEYWGIYQTDERPEASYAASYFGGNSDDYDIVKNDPRNNGATDGTLEAYQRLWDYFVQQDGLSDANMDDYFEAQGMNPDGTRNPDFERLLDIDNVIDYMVITYYTSDADGPGSKFTRPGLNNYLGAYNRENPDGFKFFEHDSEHSLDTGNAAGANYNMVTPLLNNGQDFNHFNPHWMHEQLAQSNSVYLERFINRITELFDENGLFSDENLRDMLQFRADQISSAIIGESARWGNTGNESLSSWQTAVETTKNWIVGRRQVVLDQLRTVGWYPENDPPLIFPAGGTIDVNQEVELSLPLSPFDTDAILVAENATVSVLVPVDGSLGTSWTGGNEPFDDGSWIVGSNGVGYEDGSGFESYLNTILPGRDANDTNGTTSAYIRAEFSVADTNAIDNLVLRMRYDDGFVAYLNGQEVERFNAPGAIGTPAAFDATATGTNNDISATIFADFVIDKSLLSNGLNVLAIQALNASAESNDFLNQFRLVNRETSASQLPGIIYYTLDGTDPRDAAGQPNATAIAYNSAADFVLDQASGTYLVPTGNANEQNWQTAGYDDSSWTAAVNGVGFDTGVIDSVPGFSVRVVDASSGAIGNIETATTLLNGDTTGFTIAADTTEVRPYVNFGGGNLTSPPVLPFFGTSDL